MTQREATVSRSATTLVDTNARASESPIFQAFKRTRPNPSDELQIPSIVADDVPFASASTETVISAYETPLHHPTSSDARYLVSKLDRLHDKKERYQSHLGFLQKCLEENIIPKGLRLELEPSIGNHDEEFLKNWYAKLEEYSKSFMKDVIAFCDKTNTQTNNDINDVNQQLESAVQKEQYDHVQETIIQNNNLRNQDLKRRKMKKYHALKYAKKETAQHPQRSFRQDDNNRYEHQTRDQTQDQQRSRSFQQDDNRRHGQQIRDQTQDQQEQNNSSYATVLKRSAQAPTVNHSENRQEPRRTRSRQYLSRQTSRNNINEPLHEQISLQRKNAYRKQENNEEQLKSRINQLQTQLNSMQGSHNTNTDTPAQLIETPKNLTTAQSCNTGPSHNKDIMEAYTYVSSAMQTLKQFETKFAAMLNINTTPSEKL